MEGYSKTPLLKKLGIKPGHKVLLVGQPDHYLSALGRLPDGVDIFDTIDNPPYDFIHLFAENREVLRNKFSPLKKLLKKNGLLWVSWIKKASGLETDISENDVRSLGLEIGLVDVKICAVDKDWSALKFMYRKKDR